MRFSFAQAPHVVGGRTANSSMNAETFFTLDCWLVLQEEEFFFKLHFQKLSYLLMRADEVKRNHLGPYCLS